MFENRTLLIATMHGKEKVIAPLLERHLGVRCIVPDVIDTDLLGAFSGETERVDDPLTTARNKCKMALSNSDCDLAVASEGSFGPHPSVFFVPADEEILMLYDQKNELEVVVSELSTETNFAGAEIESEQALKAFAEEVSFPSHALILKTKKDVFQPLKKGISDWETLMETYHQFVEQYGAVYAETDMRAMHNPTRMGVIEKATKRLVEKLLSCCPKCHTPGYGVAEAKQGLPCESCGTPTRSTLSFIYRCQRCGHSDEIYFPHTKKTENPMYCDVCNP